MDKQMFTRQLPCQHCAGRWVLVDNAGEATVTVSHQGEEQVLAKEFDRWLWQQRYRCNLGRVARELAQSAHPLKNLRKSKGKVVRRG